MESMKANLKSKWMGFKVKVRVKTKQGLEWIKNNKEEAAILATIGTSILTGAVKMTVACKRDVQLSKEQYLKDRTMYDRSLGAYHHLKHKLRPYEIQEIDARRTNGESLAYILNDMNLIE